MVFKSSGHRKPGMRVGRRVSFASGTTLRPFQGIDTQTIRSVLVKLSNATCGSFPKGLPVVFRLAYCTPIGLGDQRFAIGCPPHLLPGLRGVLPGSARGLAEGAFSRGGQELRLSSNLSEDSLQKSSRGGRKNSAGDRLSVVPLVQRPEMHLRKRTEIILCPKSCWWDTAQPSGQFKYERKAICEPTGRGSAGSAGADHRPHILGVWVCRPTPSTWS